jgi:16S rRNA (adenine(1408)-N(1))-methyltransferase
VTIDVGTGDGRAVLARAAAEPSALAIGIDASAVAMAESSRRAHRRGPHNARFFAEAAEVLPGPLAGTGSLVTVSFPWGSLLQGVLGRRPAVLCGIAGLVAPGGALEILVSVTERDRIPGVATLDGDEQDRLTGAWVAAGLELISLRPASSTEVDASRSSWARRLGDRPVSRLTLRRPLTALAPDGLPDASPPQLNRDFRSRNE